MLRERSLAPVSVRHQHCRGAFRVATRRQRRGDVIEPRRVQPLHETFERRRDWLERVDRARPPHDVGEQEREIPVVRADVDDHVSRSDD